MISPVLPPQWPSVALPGPQRDYFAGPPDLMRDELAEHIRVSVGGDYFTAGHEKETTRSGFESWQATGRQPSSLVQHCREPPSTVGCLAGSELERLRDLPTDWSQQWSALGLKEDICVVSTKFTLT